VEAVKVLRRGVSPPHLSVGVLRHLKELLTHRGAGAECGVWFIVCNKARAHSLLVTDNYIRIHASVRKWHVKYEGRFCQCMH
jgi:hypothetical protein